MGEPDPDAVDYYSRIGVGPDADHETVERERKRADRRFSPMSSSPEADERHHMRINAASSVLEDPDSRECYDTFYETFGRIEGTAVYETLAEPATRAVVDEPRLLAHLCGFVEVLGPVDGARRFQKYYDGIEGSLPEAFDELDLPDGYSLEDVGFGVAAWSFRTAGEPCSFGTWLSGGRDLWRAAIQDPEDAPELVAELTGSHEQATAGAPTTRLEEGGDDSSDDLPREYVREEVTTGWGQWPSIGIAIPSRRVGRTLSYLVLTTLWATGSTAVAAGSGLLGLVAGIVVFVPLLALGLVVRSSFPGIDAAVQSSVGVPLADPAAPLAGVSLVHYLTVAATVVVAMWLAGWTTVRLHERRSRGFPRGDAWLVFGFLLAGLAAALFAGVGAGALPRPVSMAATGLITAVTFQAAMDVRAPQELGQLCRSVSTMAFGLAGIVAALVATDRLLVGVAPDLAATTYASLVPPLPLVDLPLSSMATAEPVVVGFGALALVPLALTTLYSVAYAAESLAIRYRSGVQGT